MAETVTMPKLGFDMAEGTLVRWVKALGEAVSKGEVLAEIETDKATVEVESPYSGVVHKHLVDQGAVVPVGTPIAVVTAPGETVAESEEGRTEPMPTGAPEPEAEQEVAKKVEETAAPPAETSPAPQAQPQPAQASSPTAQQPSQGGQLPGGVAASPLARKVAQERGLDLSQVKGSGPGGRITRKDVESAAGQPVPAAAPAGQPAAGQPATAAEAQAEKPTWVPAGEIPADMPVEVDRLRAAIGRRMVESRQQVPHFYVTHSVDAGPLMALRKQANEQLPDDGKLSVNEFIVKAAALALREFPNLNAALKGSQIVRFGHVNIGNAVALPSGLMTVVVRDADQKPVRLIGAEVKEMAARARSGKVRPDDIEGSTFSISNLGMYDVEDFVAIINPPEAAILAVGSAKQVPVVVDGELQVGWRMNLTLSADHRVTDGAEAAQFMQALARNLETPIRLML